MELAELAGQYRESAELCRARACSLMSELESEALGSTEELRLRRRICILSSMAREAAATGKYLEHYYERRNVYERKNGVAARGGVSGFEEVYKAGRFIGR